MKINQTIGILFSFIILWSCNNSTSETENKDVQKVTVEEQLKDEHPHEMEGLTLNHGERWQANEATTTAIANMLEQVNVYEATPGENENVRELQEELNNEFKLLVERCTMKGEAHEQLHHYILPLKTFIDELDEGNVDKNIQVIKEYLLMYEDYFV